MTSQQKVMKLEQMYQNFSVFKKYLKQLRLIYRRNVIKLEMLWICDIIEMK
jgi:hypothetical protein